MLYFSYRITWGPKLQFHCWGHSVWHFSIWHAVFFVRKIFIRDDFCKACRNHYNSSQTPTRLLVSHAKKWLSLPLQRNLIKCLQYYFFRFDTCEVQTKLLCFGSMSSIRSHTVPLCTVDKIESRGLLTVNTRATSLWVCTELCLWPIWMKLQRGTGSLPHEACPH